MLTSRGYLRWHGVGCGAAVLSVLLLTAAPATGLVLDVTSLADSGPGTLRQAILDANATPGLDTITFSVAGGGPHVIQPLSGLPTLTEPTVVDGLTQPGADCSSWPPTLQIELDGSLAPNGTNGLTLGGGGGHTVRGLVVNSFSPSGFGSFASGGAGVRLTSSNNTLHCNLLGTQPDGTTPAGSFIGVLIASGTGNAIGGPDTAGADTVVDRNLLSGHDAPGVLIDSGATGNTVAGNFIGTDVTGTLALGNNQDDAGFPQFVFAGVEIEGSGNIVGGTSGVSMAGPCTGTCNVIAGNLSSGVAIGDNNARFGTPGSDAATGNTVQHNFIGTDATGTATLGNLGSGVHVARGGDGTQILDNLVSANLGGVLLDAARMNVLQRNLIGTDVTGILDLGNQDGGVLLTSSGGGRSPDDNLIGDTDPANGNRIAFNDQIGTFAAVFVLDGVRNRILGNSIHSHSTLLGIGLDFDFVTSNDPNDVDTGPNALQNFPLLTAVSLGGGMATIEGMLQSTPSTTYRIEFFANTTCDPSWYGEGETFIGTADVTTDGTGTATINETFPFPAGQEFFTATATDPLGNTSELSQCVWEATPLLVIHTGDGGKGSLRDAIAFANATPGHDTIEFDIHVPSDLGCNTTTRVCTIRPASPLPALTESATIDALTQPNADCTTWPPALKVVLDGSQAGAGATGLDVTAGGTTVRGLVVNNFSANGIRLATGGGNTVECNFLGTDASGTSAEENECGLLVEDSGSNQIGGPRTLPLVAPATGGGPRLAPVDPRPNLVSGNDGFGIQLTGSGSTDNGIEGNYVGTDVTGTLDLGNGQYGIRAVGSGANTIGGATAADGNVIAFNTLGGIAVEAPPSTGKTILSNAIFANGGLGIDLGADGVTANDPNDVDPGPNALQNFPVIERVASGGGTTTITGRLDSAPSVDYLLQFFDNTACDPSDHGEGEILLGSATRQAGPFIVSLPVPLGGAPKLTATATDPAGNTSELSLCGAEVCDNCIDDDGDLDVDRADNDCTPVADGMGMGLDDPKGRGKAAFKCAKDAAKAGQKYSDAVLKRLQKCLAAVHACLQKKPDDPRCLPKATAKCAKELDKLDAKDGPKLVATLQKKCSEPKLPAADLLSVMGVGFNAESTPCLGFDVASLDDVGDVAACVLAHHRCRATQIIGVASPRAFELLTLVGRDPVAELPCLLAASDGGGAGLGDPKDRGKGALKCDKALGKLAAKFAKNRGKTLQKCGEKVFKCLQLKPADPRCLAKAQQVCAKQLDKLTRPGKGIGAKLLANVAKKCAAGVIAAGDLLADAGLGFGAHAARCAALGVASLADVGDVAECLKREQECRTDQLLARQFPRTPEMLDLGAP